MNLDAWHSGDMKGSYDQSIKGYLAPSNQPRYSSKANLIANVVSDIYHLCKVVLGSDKKSNNYQLCRGVSG